MGSASDMEDQTEQIETLTALKTSEKNATYMQERAERLEESLQRVMLRGTLRAIETGRH